MEFENLLKLIQAVSDSELTGLKYEEKGVKLSPDQRKRNGNDCGTDRSRPEKHSRQQPLRRQHPLHRQHRHPLPLRQQGQKNRKWKGTS